MTAHELEVNKHIVPVSTPNLSQVYSNESSVPHEDDQDLTIVLSANVGVCIVGTITNLTAFLVFNRSRPASTMVNMLLCLSVAEMILSLTAGGTASLHLLYQVTGESLQIVRSVFSDAHFIGLTVRNLWVAFIAFKRWDATARPLRPLLRKCSKARLAKFLAGMYLLCTGMLSLFYTGLVPNDFCGTLMFYFWYMMVSNALTFALIALFGVLTVIKSGSMARYTGSDSMRPSLRKRQRAVTKTIVTLLATFLVCEVTFFCIHTLYYRETCSSDLTSQFISPAAFYVGYMLTDVDSICNFVIYCFCYASFRRRLRNYIICRNAPDSPTVSQSVHMARASSMQAFSKSKQVSLINKEQHE